MFILATLALNPCATSPSFVCRYKSKQKQQTKTKPKLKKNKKNANHEENQTSLHKPEEAANLDYREDLGVPRTCKTA